MKTFVFVLILDLITLTYATFFGDYPRIPLFDATCYRILYIHVPLAWDMYFAFTLTFVFSLLYLLRSRDVFDRIAFCSAILGVLYGIGALVSGMLWAKEVWHSFWSWDPRQTTTLIALLAYLCYTALRNSIRDVERAKTVSAVFGVSAYTTIPISYISAIVTFSRHVQLPHQPLSFESQITLLIRVLTSFALFLAILRFYSKKRF